MSFKVKMIAGPSGAHLKVLQWPHKALSAKCEPATLGADVRELAYLMQGTIESLDALGLAASQVGVLVRLFVLSPHAYHGSSWTVSGDLGRDEETDHGPFVFVNPEVTEHSSEKVRQEEACLSLRPFALVSRWKAVVIRATDLDGRTFSLRAHSVLAAALQHELDHLDGIMTIDRVGPAQRDLMRRRLGKLKRRGRQKTKAA